MRLSSSLLDSVINVVDEGLRTCLSTPTASRPSPADTVEESRLTSDERRQSIALMRVNHAGEVAAQALYAGQSIFARTADTRQQLLAAASEELDHLAWCDARLSELGGNRSRLVPFWFTGSAVIGAVAALASDRVSLGFVQETERQVEAHLEDHLERLPIDDAKSRAILEKMALDEARHGRDARAAGASELPDFIRSLMTVGGGTLRSLARIL